MAAGPPRSVAVVSLERETVSDGGRTKELRPRRCSVNQASCFQSLNNVWTAAAFIMQRWKGEVFFLCFSRLDHVRVLWVALTFLM